MDIRSPWFPMDREEKILFIAKDDVETVHVHGLFFLCMIHPVLVSEFEL